MAEVPAKAPARELYDVIVIGGGPAGLTAAIYLARACYRVLVIEKEHFGGQITITDRVVNYPGIASISGAALTENMRQQAEAFGAEFKIAEVTALDMSGDIKTLHTTQGILSCFGILLAAGARPRSAGFTGEEAFRGRGVAYCATCDGEFFRGKQVFVVGSGYAAAEESVFLTKYASHVTCLVRGDDFTPQWTLSYMGALLYLALFGSVIAFGAYFTLVGRIGAGKAAYSTLLFPLVALTISTFYEGYVWHSNAVIGLALILVGNLVMFARPEQWFLRRRLA